MNDRRPRSGFTAVELLVVIGIMMVMMGIAVPTVMPAIRRGKINSAVNDIMSCWRQARALAIATPTPPGATPAHFGICISQVPGEQVKVGLIFDNVAAGTPRYFMQSQDPFDFTTYSVSGTPASLFAFNRNVLVNATTTTAAGTTVILYAQYGTGLPISPNAVAANHGLVAAPASLGVSAAAAAASSVCPQVQLRTLDYQATPRRGYASNVSIYNAGFTAAQEL